MRLILATAMLCATSGWAYAQVPTPKQAPGNVKVAGDDGLSLPASDKTLIADTSPQQALFDKFTKLMSGAKMKGVFTIDGLAADKQMAETYEIEKVEKQPDGDEWIITARIKYGDKDGSFPVPVEVKWAGKTPVITLDNITIPGLGTFSARVLFHGDRYAGTWQHDDKGGHMFGKLELPK